MTFIQNAQPSIHHVKCSSKFNAMKFITIAIAFALNTTDTPALWLAAIALICMDLRLLHRTFSVVLRYIDGGSHQSPVHEFFIERRQWKNITRYTKLMTFTFEIQPNPDYRWIYGCQPFPNWKLYRCIKKWLHFGFLSKCKTIYFHWCEILNTNWFHRVRFAFQSIFFKWNILNRRAEITFELFLENLESRCVWTSIFFSRETTRLRQVLPTFKRIEFIKRYFVLSACNTPFKCVVTQSAYVRTCSLVHSPLNTKTEQSNYIICGVEFDVCCNEFPQWLSKIK